MIIIVLCCLKVVTQRKKVSKAKLLFSVMIFNFPHHNVFQQSIAWQDSPDGGKRISSQGKERNQVRNPNSELEKGCPSKENE